MNVLRVLFWGEDDGGSAGQSAEQPAEQEHSGSDLRIWSAEIRDHDKTGCTGKDFIEPWYGGLVCTKCGR